MDPRGRERLATVLPCMAQDDDHGPHFYNDSDGRFYKDRAEEQLYWCSGLGRPEAEED